MSQHDSVAIRKPRTDDRPLWNVVLGLYGYPAVLVAHKLKLFPLLAEKPHTLQEVCDVLHIARRPAEALLSVCASLELATDIEVKPTWSYWSIVTGRKP